MNDEKPVWYSHAKGRALENADFTEEMKQEVIRRLHQRQQSNQSYKKLSIALLTGVFAILSFFIVQEVSPKTLSSLQSLFSDVNEDQAAANQDEQDKEEFKLTYQYSIKTPADLSDDGIWAVTLPTLSKSSVIINEERAFPGIGTYLSYFKSDKEPINYGIEIEGSSKEGQLFEFGSGSMKEVSLSRSNALGVEGWRLSGVCGPELVCTSWLSVGENGEANQYLRLDSASYEADLDGDGITEVIVTTSAYMGYKVYIYKNRNGRIEWAEVDEALQVNPKDTITFYPDTQLFKVNSSEGTRTYRYGDDEDKLVRINK